MSDHNDEATTITDAAKPSRDAESGGAGAVPDMPETAHMETAMYGDASARAYGTIDDVSFDHKCARVAYVTQRE